MHHRKRKLIIRKRIWLQTFFFQQFHVFFNFFFKVFFIFRSFYLCAIDLWSIFNFKWNISFILSCIFKQLDSSKKFHMKVDRQSHTKFSLSMTFYFKEFKSIFRSKHFLQITIRTSKKSNFKFELLSLHSSLLK